jgi:hypothetical protein
MLKQANCTLLKPLGHRLSLRDNLSRGIAAMANRSLIPGSTITGGKPGSWCLAAFNLIVYMPYLQVPNLDLGENLNAGFFVAQLEDPVNKMCSRAC